MAVVSVKERAEKRRSSWRDGRQTHIRVYLVRCSDPRDGTAAALIANDGTNHVPLPGEYFSDTRQDLRANGIDAEPVQGSDLIFEVVVEFTDQIYARVDNPLKRPAEISYSNEEVTEPYFVDRSKNDPDGKGKLVVNTAGDAFENYFERETGRMIITVTVNEATHNPVAADEFSHTVNKDAVTIDGTTYDKGTLKLSPITAQKITETVNTDGVSQQFTYYRRTYTIKARRDGWRDKPLDVGMNELIPDPTDPNKPGKLRPIVDSANLPVKKPWPLSKGKKKPKATDKPDVLDFQPYEEVSWDDLKPFQASTWPPVVTL